MDVPSGKKDVPSGKKDVPGAWHPLEIPPLPQVAVTFKELLTSEVIQAEALINLLDRKMIISKHVLLEEIRAVQA
jgi:hypothetical protein